MILNFIKRNTHFFVLSYYLVIMVLYNVAEKVTRPKYYMYSFLDDYIPFVKEMVIPYVIWYFYIFGALVYLGFVSKDQFFRMSLFMFSGMTICFIIYFIWPNGQNLRPVITQNDVFSSMIKGIYAADTPTNSAPSMHVLDSIAVHIGLMHCEKIKNNKFIMGLSFITMISIIASTVMIKQHSILDVFYGILLSAVLYVVIYQFDILQYFQSDKKPALSPSSN